MGVFDSVRQFRQLQNASQDELLAQVMPQIEGYLIRGLGDVSQRVRAYRSGDFSDVPIDSETGWLDREQVREHLESLDEDEQFQQFEQVMAEVEAEFRRFFVTYHEMTAGDVINAEAGNTVIDADGAPSRMIEAGKSLIVTLHSPVVQESLLLAVAPMYRDRMRDQFREFGHLFWGWLHVTAGMHSEHGEIYLEHAAMRWPFDHEALLAFIYGGE